MENPICFSPGMACKAVSALTKVTTWPPWDVTGHREQFHDGFRWRDSLWDTRIGKLTPTGLRTTENHYLNNRSISNFEMVQIFQFANCVRLLETSLVSERKPTGETPLFVSEEPPPYCFHSFREKTMVSGLDVPKKTKPLIGWMVFCMLRKPIES